MACADRGPGDQPEDRVQTAEAFHLTTIGDIYLALGDYEKALEFNKDALRVAGPDIGKWSREECLNTIGSVYIELGDYALAMVYFQEALAYIRKIGHGREEARCLYNIGLAHFKAGDLPSARESFSESLRAAKLADKKVIQAQNLNRLGDLYRELGSWDRSKDSYRLAQAVGREIGQPSAIWEAYAGLGALYAARKEIPPAIENYRSAIGIIEDMRVQLLLREYSSGFFKSKVPIYEALVDLLWTASEKAPAAATLEECLYYAEKAKARSFLDDLQKARIDPGALTSGRRISEGRFRASPAGSRRSGGSSSTGRPGSPSFSSAKRTFTSSSSPPRTSRSAGSLPREPPDAPAGGRLHRAPLVEKDRDAGRRPGGAGAL